jgi:hypothetical protein
MKALKLFTIIAGVLLVAACTTDAYDKGEGRLSMVTAEMADAHANSEKLVDYVDTDEGERLQMQTPFTGSWVTKPDSVYRVLFYYKKDDSGKAEPMGASRVGVVHPKPVSQFEDGVKTDGLYWESAWLSRTRKYLNLRLRLLTGSTDDEKARHSIGLMKDAASSTPGHARMVLYHDQGGMPEYYSMVTYASIPLDSIKADTLTIVVKTYNGEVNRTFKLRSSDSSVVL